jgi:lipopolysaccharide transport system ATP-binding protein
MATEDAGGDVMAAVFFDNVSKRFILHHERPRSFQEWAIQTIQRRANLREPFWALRDVSFSVEQGEMLGIIGENGAGKSTVLKLISRILEPTTGRVTVQGRVSALIELGAGFHPDLTGRENIYLNGSILGLSKREMDRQFAAIVDFAELERFIDTPVKHYSSGMYARLGFAVAIHVHPDVLLIDEVLAVGDEAFQKKCLERVATIKAQGKTIIFVSHNLDLIRAFCTSALWLDQGVVQARGRTGRVIDSYLKHIATQSEWQQERPNDQTPRENRWGNQAVEIIGVDLLDAEGYPRRIFETGEAMVARIRYVAHQEVKSPVFGVAIHRADGTHVNGPNTRLSGFPIERLQGAGEVRYAVEALPLLAGEYEFSAAVYDDTCQHAYDHHHRLYRFQVQQGRVQERFGLLYFPCRWEHIPENIPLGDRHE